MKKYSIKNLKQKMIASIATVIIIFNVLVPPRSEAIVSEIADTLQSLVCWLGDAVINGLQEFFMGESAVFENYADYQQKINEENLENAEGIFENLIASCGVFFGKMDWFANLQGLISGDKANYKGPVALIKYSVQNIVANKVPAFDINFFKPMASVNGKQSTAAALKSVVQKWYYAFRNLALVALLSILVYLGIKIVLSSASADKAKYKSSLKNWLMAILILFSLHYIMAFTLNIIDKLNDVVVQSITESKKAATNTASGESKDNNNNVSSNDIYEYDTLIGSIRIAAEEADGYTDNMIYTIMYTVLIVYTIMFTVIYFKRSIYIIFLTMIAPLVAVTYPLDKEGDGKSQAFDMWFKEYFFNALIQPVHLMLYYVLVGSAQELVNENWVYALVAIGFMLPAEKLIRRMFGMEKAGGASALGGFTGGALAMNALGKLKSARKIGPGNKGKESITDGSENSKIKMAKLDDVFDKNNGDSENLNSGIRENSNNTSNDVKETANVADSNNKNNIDIRQNDLQDENATRRNGLRGKAQELKDKIDNKVESTPALRGGAAIGKKVFTRKNAVKGIKAIARGTVKGSAIAAGAIIGASAGIASGDASNMIKYAGLGAGAGSGAANMTIRGVKGLGTSASNLAKNTKETYQKGYYGSEEEYQKQVVIPKLKEQGEKNKELQEKYKKLGIDMKTSTGRNALFQAGYVDENDILKALKVQQKSGVSDKELVQNAIMSKQVKKFADISSVQDELSQRLEKSGLDENKAKEEAERRMKDIKKLAGLT